MKKEHIIHFKIIRKNDAKLLRGVIFLEDQQQPTLADFEQVLKDCGHDVRLKDKEHTIFSAYKPGEQYLITIMEDHDHSSRDWEAELLAKNFLKNEPLL
ncbi:hypothetical protein [Paenibacillus sp. SI8]|uniref:hypothetical protein n=1 Tax=unclassified Paenibacillus TaxID=185978 RepID=UPI0034677414